MNQISTLQLNPELPKILERVHAIGREIIAPHSEAVDRDSRFPFEAFEALKKEKLLSSYVSKEYGGMGFNLGDLSKICEALSAYCASTSMIYAMHQIQVACITHHALHVPFFQSFIRELVEKQLLLGSATTELGVGGDVRSSICFPVIQGETLTIEKQAPVISYGDEADVILVTARRAEDAAKSDQVHIVLKKSDYTLTRTHNWDAMGFRGTCSHGFVLKGKCRTEQMIPVPYAEIHSKSMHPFAHSIWSSLWLGIAVDAVNKARSSVRAEARKTPGTIPPTALRLAELDSVLFTMRSSVQQAIAEYETLLNENKPDSIIGNYPFVSRMNNLKITASQLVVEIVGKAMSITGIAGYRNDSKLSLTRHLRDAYGAALMVHNDRILGQSSTIQVMMRDS